MFSKLFDRITRLSVESRWLTIALSITILIAGGLALGGLNQELLPRVEFPQTIIVGQWSDAESVDQFLNEVTVPLETSLAEIDGVVNVESTTNRSFAFIVVRNEFGLNQERLLADIEAAVANTSLPAGMDEPNILNFSLSDLPVIIASVSSSDLTLTELKALVETDLEPRLQAVAQVSEVTISGGQLLPEEAPPAAQATGEDEPVRVAQISGEDEAVPTAGPTPHPTAVPTATAVPNPDPEAGSPLPFLLVQGMKSYGYQAQYAEDITVPMAQVLVAQGEAGMQALALLTPDNLRAMAPDVLAYMPSDYVATLDAELQAELNERAAGHGGIGQFSLADAEAAADEGLDVLTGEPLTGEPGDDAPALEPLPLPDAWSIAAAAAGLTLTTTADVTPQVMGGIIQMAPELLDDLEPAMWRVLDPAAVAVALPQAAETLDPELLLQLEAILRAAAGTAAEPVALPDSWLAAAAGAGFAAETTADISPEAMAGLANFAPELLSDLTPEMILAFPPDVQAALPADYIASLEDGLQETLAVIAVHDNQHRLAQAAETEAEPIDEKPVDPGRLPEPLIQGARAAGVEISNAQDLEPDFMRQLGALGGQATQALSLLTADNLRLLQPEVIALLPADYLATLDPALRAELDELAAEFGGAGALALAEAEAAAAMSADSPPLSGIWLEPGPEGEPSQFRTAADILNNPFVPGAANFLNFFPESPTVQRPAEWMAALTPEVIGYLADNEPAFISLLSPVVLEMMASETLVFMLDHYPDAFDASLAERLRAIAGGEVMAFIPESTVTRTDGNASVTLSIFKDGDANTVLVAERVFDLLDAYQVENPTVRTTYVFEQASFITESIEGVSREGALGALFAVIVILIFLSGQVRGRYKLNWRATVITGLSIPSSVLFAFLLMRWVPPTLGVWLTGWADNSGNLLLGLLAKLFPNEITLNIMTLSGLTVAIGRVVDDSIVVLENIYRFVQRGDDPKTAVVEGTREVAVAIFSATVTTMAVFLPLGLIGGLIGSFFLPFGLTVTYALAASFIVSITVVPALAFLLIRREHLPEEKETTMQRAYTPSLVWALNHRGMAMALATALFVASLFLLNGLPQSFIPSIGEPTINVRISLPPGTTMVETNAAVERLEDRISDLNGIETILTEVGSGGGVEALFGGGGINQNAANMTISVADQADLDPLTDIVRREAEAIFGREDVIVSAASQTGFSGFGLIVTGESIEALTASAGAIKAELARLDADKDGRPDLVNVSSNVDDVAPGGDQETIIRIDGRPAISFSAELQTADTIGITTAAKESIESLDSLPAGAKVTEGFDSQQQTEGFQGMITAIGYSIIIVYFIMALTFRSLVHPFTILFSLPFALVGAAVALAITDSVLGISAMVGLLMLVGIVVTNGIVLMELVQQLRQRGETTYDALVEAGRTRLRPIWMTALTAILALTPLALSQEGGAIIAAELATTVMGGLLVSTALTLIVIPVVYSLLDEVGARLRQLRTG